MATGVEDSSHGYRSRGQYSYLLQLRSVLNATAVEDSTNTYSSGGQYSKLQQQRTVQIPTVVEDSTQSYCSGGQYSKLQQQRTVQIPTVVEDSTYGYMCIMVQYIMICLATQKQSVGILIQQYSRVQYAWLHRRGVQESLYSSIVEIGMLGYTGVEYWFSYTVVQQSIVCFAMYEQSVGIISWQNSTVWYAWLHRSRVWFSLYRSIVRCGMLGYTGVEYGSLVQQYRTVWYARLQSSRVQESFYSGIAHYGMPRYRAVEYCNYRTVVQYSTVWQLWLCCLTSSVS